MGQSLQRTVAFLFLVASGGVLASSCVVNESTIFIRGCLALPNDTCTVTPDISAKEIFAGQLDPSQATGYSGVLLVGNQLVARGDTKQLRTETSRVEFQAADVTIYDSTTTETFIQYSVPASGFADPGTAAQPGFGAVAVLLVDAKTASQHVGDTLVAGVILRGRTLGGIEVETGEWRFPVDILQRGRLCNLDPCKPGTMVTDMPILTCHPGFDSITDCRQGCTCTPGIGDCAPLGCVLDHAGDGFGTCGACTSSSQCTAPTKCVITAPSKVGVCK